VFILVQWNITEQKLCYSFVCYCSLCDRLNSRKNWFLCALWLSVHMKSVVEEEFSTNSQSTTERLKHSSNFESDENIQSLNVVEFEFELRHIPNYKTHHITSYTQSASLWIWLLRIRHLLLHHLHDHHLHLLLLVQSFTLDLRRGSSANHFLHRPFPFLPDWILGLSDHLMFLFCSTAGLVCMVC